MLNFPGPEKILMLAILALIVLGPTRLPEAARTAGKWVAELRKLTSRFQEEVSGALAEPKDALTAAVGDLRNEVGGWRNEIVGMGRSMATGPSTTGPSTSDGTWSNGTSSSTYAPSTAPPDSVPSGLAPAGLPFLPPAPDDPSLN
ncbi:MAG: twin-arginine translocase TatA/TatE family subunit [Actinomycetota bacterium]|nr:twin-arginine translocase TatA/TatE family subunit [Actinomycetota bacterium]